MNVVEEINEKLSKKLNRKINFPAEHIIKAKLYFQFGYTEKDVEKCMNKN